MQTSVLKTENNAVSSTILSLKKVLVGLTTQYRCDTLVFTRQATAQSTPYVIMVSPSKLVYAEYQGFVKNRLCFDLDRNLFVENGIVIPNNTLTRLTAKLKIALRELDQGHCHLFAKYKDRLTQLEYRKNP